jgi:crotonobetainyl-CoA:carnitine CoA-transferase CaiB-like acyl-CoA transferase
VTEGPLTGVRVIDFSLYLPGPYASRVLCDLGAEVIKVEPLAGDPGAEFMPGTYAFLNRGKRIVRVNLKHPEGLALVRDLISTAAVVLEGFRPGVAERLGIGFDACARLNAELIYGSLSGYGQTGPDRDRPGHDVGYEASGGTYAAALAAGDDLTAPAVPVGDLGGALFAATTICAHLVSPRTEPVHLDVALQEAVTHLSVSRWSTALRDGTDVDISKLAAFSPGMGLFRTGDDRWVALASVEDKFWSGMCAALGLTELRGPPYDTHAGRMRERVSLHQVLAEQIGRITLADLDDVLRRHDVPVDLVRGPREIADDPHLRERELFLETDAGTHVDYPVRQNGRRSVSSHAIQDHAGGESEALRALDVSTAREAALRASGALAPARSRVPA